MPAVFRLCDCGYIHYGTFLIKMWLRSLTLAGRRLKGFARRPLPPRAVSPEQMLVLGYYIIWPKIHCGAYVIKFYHLLLYRNKERLWEYVIHSLNVYVAGVYTPRVHGLHADPTAVSTLRVWYAISRWFLSRRHYLPLGHAFPGIKHRNRNRENCGSQNRN